MKLSKEDVIKLAQLAKLKLTDSEVRTYQKQLVQVLDYFNKVKELKLAKVPESLTGIGDNPVGPRPDVVAPSAPEVIKQAAELQEGLVASPEVFEK